MIIKKINDVAFEQMSQYHGSIEKQILIGPNDGSHELVMRLFTVKTGGQTPYHTHAFPHLVKIEQGRGCVVHGDGSETDLSPGSVVYVHDNEKHCFKNRGIEDFVFICIVPHRGEQ